jgi:protein-tyrosine phosphatase
VSGFIDLHCHFLPEIDDGVRSMDEGLRLLRGLHSLGFSEVVATPHMRPGMFDNDRASLVAAFEGAQSSFTKEESAASLPRVHLASEHFLDDVVFQRIVTGSGLPYPARSEAQSKRSILIELWPESFPKHLDRRLFDLGRARLRPVIAHPERYQPVWRDDHCLDPLLDAGACLLLDVCALVGKYGHAPERAAEKLLREGAYEAACSDSHRPDDVDSVRDAIARLVSIAGKAEAERLLTRGPEAILSGASS